jgi:hypothetical protein
MCPFDREKKFIIYIHETPRGHECGNYSKNGFEAGNRRIERKAGI